MPAACKRSEPLPSEARLRDVHSLVQQRRRSSRQAHRHRTARICLLPEGSHRQRAGPAGEEGGAAARWQGGRAGRPEPRDGSRSVGAASQRARNGSRRKLSTPAAGGGRRAARTGGGYLGSPARHALGRPPPVSVASSTDRSERAEQQRDPRYPGWDITAPARAARRRGGGLTCSLARAPHFRGTDLPVSPCLASRRGLA